MENPFHLSGYTLPAHFCDRKAETESIVNAMQNRRNVTLWSVRRMGKTGLIHHVLYKLKKKKTQCFLFDIYATQNTQELINLMGSRIMGSADSFTKRIATRIKDIILSFRPRITYDELSGAPSVEFYLQQDEPVNTLEKLLDYLEEQGVPVVIAIDEFQQILNYPEKNLEAVLRTRIQRLKNVRFIFSGSETHMLISMFNDSNRPFYQSTQMLHLGTIAEKEYKKFIRNWFEKDKRSISDDALDAVMERTLGHTYYVQLLCNRLFSTSLKKIHAEDVLEELVTILKENEYVYFNYRKILSNNQWGLLKAVAKEGRLRNPNAKKFIRRHDLGGASSINRALAALREKGMIQEHLDEEGSYLRVSDVFLGMWLKRT